MQALSAAEPGPPAVTDSPDADASSALAAEPRSLAAAVAAAAGWRSELQDCHHLRQLGPPS